MQPDIWQLVWRNEVLSFINHLAAALPWILGLAGAGALVGWSPLGRGLLGLRRAQERSNELIDDLAQQLATLQRSLAEVSERLEATEFHLRSLPVAPQRRRLPSAEDAQPRNATPV